jgi:trimeric autotransporter adhesin
MNPLIQLKTTPPLLVTLALLCFGFLSGAQAVVPPPPGGYANFTTAAGDHALQALTLGFGNTAIGTFSLFSVTTGNFNTALGAGALDLNTADSNTATGAAALLFNTIGTENTANGTAALEFNETGSQNTATGAFALFNNTTGSHNTATGHQALISNTTGFANTATGEEALLNNTTGDSNTASGSEALLRNTTGRNNTATGPFALGLNATGNDNTATGFSALLNNTGSNNTACGSGALQNGTGDNNTACGAFAQQSSSGNNNIALGFNAGSNLSTGDFNIDIGALGVAGESATIRIGRSANQDRTFIAGITGVAVTGTPVVVDGSGQLGVAPSSRRFKKEVKPMAQTSEAILALKPVTFQYKSDTAGTPQFGLIAEEVAEVNPDLVVHDKEGKPYSVRYDQVNAMLLNEFLKEHRKVQELAKGMAALTAQLEQQAGQIQKVSARIEMNKSGPQVVANKP